MLVLTCAGCFQPSPPEVKLQDYSISKVTLEGIEVNFNLEIKNPNPVPLEVANYAYRVYLNEIEFLNESRTGFSLPAADKKLVTIPIFVRYDKLYGTATAILDIINSGGQTINYRLDGTVTGGLLGITVTAPIKASGVITIPKEIK
jgi:LEA14-like dessication related protein